MSQETEECSACRGMHGEDMKDCKVCGGSGRITKPLLTWCPDCEKYTESRYMVPCCDYMPHGLKSEIPNHPKDEDGGIQCSDFAEDMPNECTPCQPYEEEIENPTKSDLEKYEEIIERCAVCDTLNKECNAKPKEGLTYFYGGKAYQVEITPQYVAIDDLYQDAFDFWHVGKPRFFAQNEDVQKLEKDAGWLSAEKILHYLDGAGVLQN